MSDGLTERFDLGDDLDDDGPTVLPPPWSEPPDPEFLTGTVPRLQRADLSGPLPPGMEPSDSSQLTVRFSREEVRALVGVRVQTARVAKLPPPARAAKTAPFTRIAKSTPTARIAKSAPSARVAKSATAARVAKAAPPARVAKSAPAAEAPQPLRVVPRASVAAPSRASVAEPPPAAWRALVSRIEGKHITLALALGSAFALGVLTGILAMS
jgi:hypothetical protein